MWPGGEAPKQQTNIRSNVLPVATMHHAHILSSQPSEFVSTVFVCTAISYSFECLLPICSCAPKAAIHYQPPLTVVVPRTHRPDCPTHPSLPTYTLLYALSPTSPQMHHPALEPVQPCRVPLVPTRNLCWTTPLLTHPTCPLVPAHSPTCDIICSSSRVLNPMCSLRRYAPLPYTRCASRL